MHAGTYEDALARANRCLDDSSIDSDMEGE